MKLTQKSCDEFAELLASKAPVPGGGGAAALAGALGAALGSMVCHFTIGKKKYAEFESRLKEILAQCDELRLKLTPMVDEDAEHFLPLAHAYGLPANTEREKALKAEMLEAALKGACDVPIRTMRMAFDAIGLHAELADKGSRLILSDVGVGLALAKAALISGKLNVLINLRMIKDQHYVANMRKEMDRLAQEGGRLADETYAKVERAIAK